MEKVYNKSPTTSSINSKIFRVSYQHNGSVLHGSVIQLSKNDYQVYVEEKEVIIHCTRNEHGALTCNLNTGVNPDWVNGISDEVEKQLKKGSGL